MCLVPGIVIRIADCWATPRWKKENKRKMKRKKSVIKFEKQQPRENTKRESTCSLVWWLWCPSCRNFRWISGNHISMDAKILEWEEKQTERKDTWICVNQNDRKWKMTKLGRRKITNTIWNLNQTIKFAFSIISLNEC